MKGFRTYIISAIVAVFGVLEMTDWAAFLDNPTAGAVALGSAILMAILRSVTSTPPGVSEEKAKSQSDVE